VDECKPRDNPLPSTMSAGVTCAQLAGSSTPQSFAALSAAATLCKRAGRLAVAVQVAF
jgi:hypothetical protein